MELQTDSLPATAGPVHKDPLRRGANPMSLLKMFDAQGRPARAASRSFGLTIELLFMIAWREIAIKYKQSVMGILWAVLMPCLIVLAGLVVRMGMARMSGVPMAPEAVADILIKALPWAFFVSAIRFSTNSLANNANLVTRSNCPRVVFPLASILSSLFDLLVATVPAVLLLAVIGVGVTAHALWVLPILLLLVVLVGSLGVMLATANLFYRDVRYIVEVFLTFGIFFTPVFYSADMIGEWKHWILLNPLAPLLEGLHDAVVAGRTPDLAWLGYSAAVTLVAAIGATVMFRRLEPIFADCI